MKNSRYNKLKSDNRHNKRLSLLKTYKFDEYMDELLYAVFKSNCDPTEDIKALREWIENIAIHYDFKFWDELTHSSFRGFANSYIRITRKPPLNKMKMDEIELKMLILLDLNCDPMRPKGIREKYLSSPAEKFANEVIYERSIKHFMMYQKNFTSAILCILESFDDQINNPNNSTADEKELLVARPILYRLFMYLKESFMFVLKCLSGKAYLTRLPSNNDKTPYINYRRNRTRKYLESHGIFDEYLCDDEIDDCDIEYEYTDFPIYKWESFN